MYAVRTINPFDEFNNVVVRELQEFSKKYINDDIIVSDGAAIVDSGHCSECGFLLTHTTDGSKCSNCGIIADVEMTARSSKENAATRVSVAGARNVFSTADYRIAQKKSIIVMLNTLNNDGKRNKGFRIPDNIINDVADTYNQMQETYVKNKKVPTVETKFVRRQRVKHEVIGTLLLYKCREHGIPMRESNIKNFMKLSDGLSRGKTIVRDLVHSGKISLQVNIDTNEDYVDRFLKLLGLADFSDKKYVTEESLRYKNFILALVKEAIVKKVGYDSTTISKVVGSIWILITHKNMDINYIQVEDACDNVRKNTFTRFSKAVERNILSFIDTFNKYGIPHGVKSRLRRVKNPEYCGCSTSIQ